MKKEALTHAAFLSLWSFWAWVAQGPRDTCGYTRGPQPPPPLEAGSCETAALPPAAPEGARGGYTPGVPGRPRSPAETKVKGCQSEELNGAPGEIQVELPKLANVSADGQLCLNHRCTTHTVLVQVCPLRSTGHTLSEISSFICTSNVTGSPAFYLVIAG